MKKLDETSSRFGMGINAGKKKPKKTKDEQWEENFNTHKFDSDELKFVSQFKYLGSIFSEDGTTIETLLSVSQITASLVNLKTIWNDEKSYLKSKIRLLSISFNTIENLNINNRITR